MSGQIKIHIDSDERYPDYNYTREGQVHYQGSEFLFTLVDKPTLDRWDAVTKAYNKIQEEMKVCEQIQTNLFWAHKMAQLK